MTVTFESTTLATPPSGTVVGSETIGGVDYQQVKLVWGSTGTATTLTSATPLPVQVTKQSSNIAVDVGTLPSVTLSSGTQVIGSVNQGTSPWVSSVTGTVAVSSGTVTLTSGSLALGSVTVSGSVAVTSGTVTLTSGSLALGSVTATLSSGTQTIGTVINSSGTQTIGTVLQGSAPWSISQTSSTGFLGSIAVTSGTITLTSGTLNLGSVAVTSGTITLTSGALALGTVTLSSGVQTIGTVNQGTSPWVISGTVAQSSGLVTLTSGTLNLGRVEAADSAVMMSTGVVVQPVQANVTTSSSFALIFTGATATQTNRIVAAVLSVSSSTTPIFGAQFMTSAAVALDGKIFMPPTPSNTVILPFNPMGWAQTTTTAVYIQTGALLSTSVSVSVTYMPL